MSEFSFEVPGPPRPWSRARRDGRTRRTFTDHKTAAAKHDIRLIGAAAMRSRGIKKAAKGVAVIISVDAFFRLPPSISAAERKARLKRHFHTIKPDADNIVKLIKDALLSLIHI